MLLVGGARHQPHTRSEVLHSWTAAIDDPSHRNLVGFAVVSLSIAINKAFPAMPVSTIIVVEPDILIRTVIAEYLRECGYRVLEAAAAEEVITVLGAGKPLDFVLCEVELGGAMNGFALGRWLREHHPQIDVILTSGSAKAAEQAGELCEDGPLPKPYHPDEVVRRINALIGKRRRQSPS